jgi:4-amino-4-deoxy-L-arabinose transferase-like glycosyltransferase
VQPPAPPGADDAGPSAGLVALLLALACVPFFLGLGHPPLWDANEPFYVEPAKEALTWSEGSVWAPTWNGRTYLGHAPLGTWAVTASYALFGIDEGTGRIPGALAAVATVLATYVLGRALGGRRVGLFAALALAATPRVWLFSRQLAGDALLTALLTWAFALAVTGLERGSSARVRSGHLLAGLAVLAKGPVALVLYAPALLITSWCARPRVPFAALKPWNGIALTLLVAAPWFVAMSLAFPDFAGTFFGWHNVGRFLGDTPAERPVWFYLVALLGDAQPWLLLLPAAVVFARRAGNRRPAAVLPWIAAAWMLLVFSASAGKRNVYLMPMYPLLAVLVAPVLDVLWSAASRAFARITAGALAVAGLGVVAALVFVLRAEPRTAPEVYAPLSVFAIGGLLALVALLRASGRAALVTGLATVLAAEAAAALALPALDGLRPVPALAARIRALEDPRAPEPAIVYGARITSLSWYLGHRAEQAGTRQDLLRALGGATRAFVLCPEKDVADLRAQAPELALTERARAPMFDFQFKRVILGQRKASEDVLLFEAVRSAPPPAPPEAVGGAVPPDGER